MIAELGALKKYHNMLIKRTTAYTGFDFSPIPGERFDQREQPREGTPVIKDEDFWTQHPDGHPDPFGSQHVHHGTGYDP